MPRKMRTSAEAEADFREYLVKLGAVPAWDTWEGIDQPHQVICAKGHKCRPRPSNASKNEGICLVCVGHDPATGETNFRARLAEWGATPAWDAWRGIKVRHKVICFEGHECWPLPANGKRLKGPCRICTGQDSATAEAAFRHQLVELGVEPDWTEWRGSNNRHRAICPVGHECWPRPKHIRTGIGPCRICSGLDPVTAEMACRKRLAELGATPAWEKWEGVLKPHRVICQEGHECWPRPGHIQQGRGHCHICAGRDPVAVEAGYVEVLARSGARPGWTEWRGTQKPHRVICKNGHECRPLPRHVLQGTGPCRRCAGREWDVFYILANDAEKSVKFGITSGDHRPRWAQHRRHGYARAVFLTRGVDAWPVEREVLATLRERGYKAVRGFEYFERDALPLILEVIRSRNLVSELTDAIS